MIFFQKKFLSILLLSLFFLSSQIVSACSIKGPDPWFSTHYNFDSENLPIGVEVFEDTDSYSSPIITIKNSNEEPFYLVREVEKGSESIRDYGVPPNYAPFFKLESNKVYEFSNGNWTEEKGISENVLHLDYYDRMSLLKIDGRLEEVRFEARPADVKIPDPLPISLLGLYKNQPIKITGKIAYSLNEKYTDVYANAAKGCSQWSESTSDINDTSSLIFYSIALVFILIVVSFVVLMIRSNSKRRQVSQSRALKPKK